MKSEFVRVGDYVVNLEQVTAAHWERGKLFVHLAGGRFEKFGDDDAKQLWERIVDRAAAASTTAGELAGV